MQELIAGKFENVRCPCVRPHKKKVADGDTYKNNCDLIKAFVPVNFDSCFVIRCNNCKQLVLVQYKDGIMKVSPLPKGTELKNTDGMVIVDE